MPTFRGREVGLAASLERTAIASSLSKSPLHPAAHMQSFSAYPERVSKALAPDPGLAILLGSHTRLGKSSDSMNKTIHEGLANNSQQG